MSLKQVGLPDISSLSISGTTIQLMEALSFSADGQYMVVKATFTEDGGQGELRYGYFVYDVLAEAYVLNINEVLLSDGRLTSSVIESISFQGTLNDYTLVAEVKDAGESEGDLVSVRNGSVVSTDILTDVLGDDFSVNVERFALADDQRHIVIQTVNPNLASVLNPDTNDSSDIYLIDTVDNTVIRVSEIGGAEVPSDTRLSDVAVINGVLQIAFVTDEAFASISRIDQNTLDTSGPLGTRSDAYVWQAEVNTDGSLDTSARFTLVSELGNGTASGFVDSDDEVVLSSTGQYFSSRSEFIDDLDNNNALDAFVHYMDGVRLLDDNGTRFDADTRVVASSANGRYVLLLSLSSNVSGSSGAQQLVWLDTQENTLDIISENSAGTQGDNYSINGVISAQGDKVAFTSLASNLTNELPNAFAGSLFIETLEGVNSPVTGSVQLDSLPLLGEDLRIDYSGLIDADGLGNEFDITWYRDGEAVESTNGILSSSGANENTEFSAEITFIDEGGNTETFDVAPFTLIDRPTLDDGTLGFTAKYVVFDSAGSNTFDLSLNFDELNFKGQSTLFSGFTTAESIVVSPGQMLDATNLKGSPDIIYLPGNLSEYLTDSSINPSIGVMTLISTADFTYTEVRFIATNIATDQLVFADGMVSATRLKEYLLANKPAEFDFEKDTSLTSNNVNIETSTANVKAIALDDTGETFTSFTPEIALQVSGGSGIDQVYVKMGTQVDATNLKGSVDEIYMQGTWSDYAKTFDGSGNLVFSRDVFIAGEIQTESISVASGSTVATNDLLIFADGSIRIRDAVTAVRNESTDAFNSLDGFDGTKTTPAEANQENPAVNSAKSLNEALLTALDGLNDVLEPEIITIRTIDYEPANVVPDFEQVELYF